MRDARVLLVGATVLGGLGETGIWLAPDLAPWVWALLVGAGQGACFALGLGLLVRFAATPRDSARLTAMAFLVSYTVASLGPATMGAVEDATGGFSVLWALLALVALPQLAVSSRLRPGLTHGRGPRPDPVRRLRSRSWPVWAGRCRPAWPSSARRPHGIRLVEDQLSVVEQPAVDRRGELVGVEPGRRRHGDLGQLAPARHEGREVARRGDPVGEHLRVLAGDVAEDEVGAAVHEGVGHGGHREVVEGHVRQHLGGVPLPAGGGRRSHPAPPRRRTPRTPRRRR